MRPRRKKEHHHHLGTTGSAPGTSQPPRCAIRSLPSLPSFRSIHSLPAQQPITIQQAELGRLYKSACPSISKDTTTRSRRDNFSGSNLSFNCSQRSHRDYFSGSPCRALNKNWHMTGPLREASSASVIAVRESPDPTQTPLRAALPDVALDEGAETPEASATYRITRADRPPVVLEIPISHPEPSEPRRCPETPGKWFRPPARGHKRPTTSSPPSPHRPRKRPSTAGRWCE